jgi:hypothetical protein
MTDADDRLCALLGADPPESVQALDDDTRRKLADLIADSRKRQAKSLEEAFTATL